MRLMRPLHHRAVHEFRDAAENGDADRLASLLDPDVAVVVDRGDRENPAIRVVRGAYEAVALLVHGMAVAAEPDVAIEERAVNAQAGLMLNRGNRTIAAMTVDFTGGLISVVWIRLRPEQLRHWVEV